LGLATPFPNKGFSSVLIVDLWWYLTVEMRDLLVEEATRVSRRVFFLRTNKRLRKRWHGIRQNMPTTKMKPSLILRYKQLYTDDDYALFESELIG
jgi:hypothetical protein